MAANAGMVRHCVGLESVWKLMREGILCRDRVGLLHHAFPGACGHGWTLWVGRECTLVSDWSWSVPCYDGHNVVPSDLTILLQ